MRAASALRHRRYPASGRAPVEVIEDGPSITGRLAWLAIRLTIRPALAIGSHFPYLLWPWGIVDFASRALPPILGTIRATIGLLHSTARLVRANGILPAAGRVVLYMHRGAFLTCGTHSHGRLTAMISRYATAPVLVLNTGSCPSTLSAKRSRTATTATAGCVDGVTSRSKAY
jgi:hypothetical protein